ncbi:lateral flagellar basal body P-ring FlgIL [Gallaecimonas kandeliae]|uniref:lateral flagellar basal body P-ring FlgIL n=1 Tax=Gallaecimonas kandeliae TaxID=3029055 RepID=UPI0026476C91|nr:lateral flagellar basal body P-ring FlgIL [Gallaecimonas kandeliae]WKE66535.1 lateral flagellar basal body P-ring FlgIL [Gallaecimonas kandeliae]
MRCFALLLALFSSLAVAQSRPLLDIADVQGLRENQLVGYGLVVGLSGTGDRNQVKFTSQSMTNMLKQFGVQLPANIDPKLKNVAAVSVHATLSSVAGRGQTLDVTVSSIGDAKSLMGGSLLMTPLRGVDGEVYAVAQGNLVVGGLKADGNDGSSVTVNVPTVGLIPGGATIEKEVPAAQPKPQVVLNLKVPNYKTARNVELAINKVFGPQVAAAQNAGRILVRAPMDKEQRVVFMSMLQDIQVQMGRQRPRVVFNSRTGTVVMGQDVKVHKAAVTHGSLTVTITEDYNVSQPNGGGYKSSNNGRTVVTPNSKINVNQERPNMFVWPDGTSLETIVQAVNSLGASPGDIMSILQALDEAGALEGDLVVI